MFSECELRPARSACMEPRLRHLKMRPGSSHNHSRDYPTLARPITGHPDKEIGTAEGHGSLGGHSWVGEVETPTSRAAPGLAV
jgi:hypothetical protein